jgi:hypothetical protein
MKLKAKGGYIVQKWVDGKIRFQGVSEHADFSNAHAAAANILLSGKTKRAQITCAIELTLGK